MSEGVAHAQPPEDVVAEWQYLADRAQQIYGGLVGLSDFGHWDSYFARTFDIYTRLWRFQQQHRATLESKDSYGLQRWEIGDIATRIAQLYYHYYLRTSDVSYLQEAYLFYDAVRTRNYYKPVGDKGKSSLASLQVKQLRFYARFIATCLLLDRRGMVLTLVEELSSLINEYATTVKGGGETQEWHLVLQEITLFLQADVTIGFKGVDFKAPSRRTVFPPRTVPLVRPDQIGQALKLQSCILVGCHQHQVKFSELTLDMYRMMYCLEKEPPAATHQITGLKVPSMTAPADSQAQPASQVAGAAAPASGSTNASRSSKSKPNPSMNPKKYLMYRPTVSQVLLYLASAHRELADNGVLLLYLSADGEEAKGEVSTASTPNVVPPASPASSVNNSTSIPPSPLHNNPIFLGSSVTSSSSSLPPFYNNQTSLEPYAVGGIRLKSENSSGGSPALSSSASLPAASPFVGTNALFPGDLTPFTRRASFIIVDSDCSHSFLNIGSCFGAPLLVLVSPQVTFSDILESSQAGSLFTYFLHDPLSAFLFTCNKSVSTPTAYEQAANKFKEITLAIDDLFSSTNDLPLVFTQFVNDEFMRLLIVRFCFCYYALKLRSPKDVSSDFLPASYPSLGASVLCSSTVITLFKELAGILGVSTLYY